MASNPNSRPRRTIDTDAYLRSVARLLRGGGKRVSDGTPDEFLQLIQLRDALDQAIIGAVRGLREAGHTWQEIGDATGTTRQAAIMKWAKKM